jgi:hypothetical protein
MGSRISGSEDVGILVAADAMTANLVGGGLYFTMTCQNEGIPPDPERGFPGIPACGQRFKFIKHTGSIPLCPRCGYTQNDSSPELRKAVSGMLVD